MSANLLRHTGATRRHFLRTALAAAGLPLTACGNHVARRRFPGRLTDFQRHTDLPFETFQIGPSNGRGVVVLHELPGLTQDDLALARALSTRGFSVYAPVLFGRPEQDSIVGGFSQACGGSPFECSKLSTRSPILDRLGPLCEEVARRTGHPVGVIGMCLTGILPLALLPRRVSAAVLCQPTVPFTALRGIPTGDQVRDLGLGLDDLKKARNSDVPFIVVHYVGDKRCPPERVDEIRQTFTQRVATIDLDGDHHSSLAGDFDQTTFDDVVDYLNVRLGTDPGPHQMRRARQGQGRNRCQIGSDGMWHAI